MNFEEFLKPNDVEAEKRDVNSEQQDGSERVSSSAVSQEVAPLPSESSPSDEEKFELPAEELVVQKAVVESLAADKVKMDEELLTLKSENNALKAQIQKLKEELSRASGYIEANVETTQSNKIALLDRSLELKDRFSGETRDHVLEALAEARDKAEAEGRLRRAQLLEAVLVENEPSGNLVKKRQAIEKFFRDNQNILSGPVIEKLEEFGIAYKHGEEYLLPAEIIKRTY